MNARARVKTLCAAWRRALARDVDHALVMAQIVLESGVAPRYAFLVLMSAGIAILGLLQSSPAVIIGAMLISPLMGPILGLGFSLAAAARFRRYASPMAGILLTTMGAGMSTSPSGPRDDGTRTSSPFQTFPSRARPNGRGWSRGGRS